MPAALGSLGPALGAGGGRTGPWQLVRGGGAAQGEPKGAPSSLQSPAEGSKQEEHG